MVGMEKIVFNRVATVLTVLYVIRFLASVLRVHQAIWVKSA